MDKTQQVYFSVQSVWGSIPGLGRLVKITNCCVEPPLGGHSHQPGVWQTPVTQLLGGDLYGEHNPLQHALQYPLL